MAKDSLTPLSLQDLAEEVLNNRLCAPEFPLHKSSSLLSNYLYVQSPDTSCTHSPRDSRVYFETSDWDQVFTLRNLSTGEKMDLRDECKATFPCKLTTFLSLPKGNSVYTEMMYFPRRSNRQVTFARVWTACVRDDLSEVKKLVDERDFNPAARTLHDWTLLHIAADAGLSNICGFLIANCLELPVDCRSTGGLTPLHLAARKGSVSTVQVLCLADAALDAQDSEGWSALHYAASHNHSEVIRYLTRHGANTALETNLKQTPADLAGDRDGLKRLRDVPKGRYGRGLMNDLMRRNSRFDSVNKLVAQIPRALALPQEELSYKDFVPVRFLGKGGFGEVYLVKKRESGSFYAMKVMRKSTLAKNGLMKCAFNELNALISCLHHPFIAQIYCVFQTPKRLHLLTDFYPGGDMRDLLDSKGNFTEDLARLYIAEVVIALEFLHQQDIIYRDVKPENIVFEENGHVRLIDFGLAKENFSSQDKSNSFCGTLNYLAPEMVSHEGHDFSLDWYMLGCTLFEMLVGRPPFIARQAKELVKLIEAGEVTFPATTSDPALTLIQGLMQPDPRKRIGAKGVGRVREHRFFNGLDWEAVYEKRLAVPSPKVRLNRPVAMVAPVKVYGDVQKTGVPVSGWTYTRPN